MGVFAGKIAKAKASLGGNYGKEGKYLVIISSGKCDNHGTKNAEQIVYEGTVIRVIDPGPPAGQRWACTDGGNDSPHAEGDPFTFHFGSWTLGAEGRAKHFLLVAAGMQEKDLPPALDPITYGPTTPGRAFMAAKTPDGKVFAQEVPPGTPGSLMAVDPVEYAIECSTNQSKNMLKDTVIEVHNVGITTQGRANGGTKKKIIAVNPIRRWTASEVQAIWPTLSQAAQSVLSQGNRLGEMLRREQAQAK